MKYLFSLLVLMYLPISVFSRHPIDITIHTSNGCWGGIKVECEEISYNGNCLC